MLKILWIIAFVLGFVFLVIAIILSLCFKVVSLLRELRGKNSKKGEQLEVEENLDIKVGNLVESNLSDKDSEGLIEEPSTNYIEVEEMPTSYLNIGGNQVNIAKNTVILLKEMSSL